MTKTLYASSNTIAGIQACIKEFYGGARSITFDLAKLFSQSPEGSSVYNSKGKIEGVRVVVKKGRYRFERV